MFSEKEMKKLEEKEKKFLRDILKIDCKVFETESEAKDEAIDKLFNSLSTIGVSQDKDGDYYTNEKGHMIDSILEKIQNI